MSRGVDHATASDLRKKGWTLRKLQQQRPDCLKVLGLRSDSIEWILDSTRPEIPFKTLAQILVANRMTCCVCKKPERGVIVHHLIEWSESHDHSEPNLAVLCLIDHDRAHSRLAHTRNLTPSLIKKFKKDWQAQVQIFSSRAILNASAKQFECWWYFNRTRLLGMAEDISVDLKQLSRYRTAHFNGWIDSDGLLLRKNQRSHYSLEGGDGGSLYAYLKEVLDETLSSVSVFNISDDLDRGLLNAVLRPGQLIFLQGLFRFALKDDKLQGPGQTVKMYRESNGVRVSAVIDRWEATSNSAWSSYLKGIQEAAAVLRVMSIDQSGGKFVVQASAIAIGAPLEGMKNRDYSNAPYRRGYREWSDFDEEESDAYEV